MQPLDLTDLHSVDLGTRCTEEDLQIMVAEVTGSRLICGLLQHIRRRHAECSRSISGYLAGTNRTQPNALMAHWATGGQDALLDLFAEIYTWTQKPTLEDFASESAVPDSTEEAL